MTSCAIVPPYLLEALASADDAGAADCARRTLDLDDAHRRRRLDRRAARPVPRPASPPTGGRLATVAGPQRAIHDAEHSQDLPGTLVRGEGDPAGNDTAVDQAYDGLGETWTFWDEIYGRDSLDGAGMALVATVHYGQDYDNAFWNGEQMVFGDGDGEVFLGFTGSLEVIGHELAHGVTQYTSALSYSGQSGALNESVSDVFGVLVKQFTLGQRADEADWLIGADLLAPGVQGVALRSMAAPGTAYDDPRLGKDPQPAHMDHYVETTDDHGGVHINSGIPNKAFHLVATAIGGQAWDRAGQIWWDAVSGEIASDCDFVTFADLTLAAARARYGDDSPEVSAVVHGWAGVGIPVADPTPTEPTPTEPTPGDPTPGDPGPADPRVVVVRRTGGLAGTTRQATVRLDQVSERDRATWEALLVGDRLAALAEPTGSVPDAFQWSIHCPGHLAEVIVDEAALPGEVRDLLSRSVR